MMITFFRTSFFVLLCALLSFVVGCGHRNHFQVKGQIEGAKDSLLYLERVEQDAVVMLDSVKCDSEGRFSFRSPRPTQVPEFYRLRTGSQMLSLAIDSTEQIEIKGRLLDLSVDYQVSGSESSEKIRMMVVEGTRFKQSFEVVAALARSKQIGEKVANDSIAVLLDRYRATLSGLILENPGSPAAFFGLFQRLYGTMAFDPYKKEDNRIFGAVATSFDLRYPGSTRTRYLTNVTLSARKAIREGEDREITLPLSVVQEVGAFEIVLPDVKGRQMKLSDLRGKVVLLNFTDYQREFSPALTVALGELYSKYKDRGMAIYQVSFDSDENLWKNSASNLPWVTVWDKRRGASPYLSIYNVQQLPRIYLLNRQGDLVQRVVDVKMLDSTIASLL